MKKQEKGITLIALVITIVILLILAGVSLNLVVGNEGILTRGKEAGDKYGKQSENEQQGLNDVEAWVNEQFGVVQKVGVDTKATAKGTINGEAPNANNPVIPKGYIPINSGNATWGDGSSAPTQDSVDHGLVIKDSKGNEWVWVPAELATLEKMCVTSNSEVNLSGDLGVSTKMYTNTTTVGRAGDTRTMERGLPNTTSKREPDLVITYDKTEAYYKTILEFNTAKEMAEAFVSDYTNMISNIRKYGGFYIGRYEMSNEGVQKGKETLVYKNWYEFYKKCSELNASEKVESRMIWGIQWDLACDFISKKGDKKSIKNSTSWGNYVNAVGNAAVMVGTTKMYGNKQVTGYSEYWKANNIYDLAGNCEEWSQEAGYDRFRAGRGGSCTMDGAELLPASARNKDGSYGYDPNLRNAPSTNNKIGEKYGKSKRRKRNNINRINSYNNDFANISWNNRRRGNKCNT